MTNERKVSLNTRYQDMNTFRAHSNSSFNRSYLLPGSLRAKNLKVTDEQLLPYSLLTQILLPMESSYFYYLWVAARPQVREVQVAWKLTFHKEHLHYEALLDKQCAGERRSMCKHWGRVLSIIPSPRPRWRPWRGSWVTHRKSASQLYSCSSGRHQTPTHGHSWGGKTAQNEGSPIEGKR